MLLSYSAIAAGIGLGIAALGGAIGMGSTAAATISGMARNPGVGGKLMTTMFIALAMIEAQVIYTLVVALILLYANPFTGMLGLYYLFEILQESRNLFEMYALVVEW